MDGKKTFKMALPGETIEREYVTEFSVYGERFVVHHSSRFLWGNETYRVSHKETGFGVPSSEDPTMAGAEQNAKSVIYHYGEEMLRNALAKARTEIAQMEEKANGR